MKCLHRVRHVGFTVLLCALAAGLQSATAQIVIRERVELQPPQTTSGTSSALGSTVSFTADEDGTLRIVYGIMRRSAVPYPQTGIALQVYRNGTLIASDPVFNRTWSQTTVLRFCSGNGSTYSEYNYAVTDTLEVETVLTGEVIDLRFATDRGVFGDGPSEGAATPRAGGGWDVALGGYDTYCQQFTDLLQVIAEIGPCSGDGFNPLCGPVASVVRRDNTPVPADSCLMVSRTRPNLNLPVSATFEGPPGTTPDPYTYRVEARGIGAGQGVTFRVEVTTGGVTTPYDYGAVEGEVIQGSDTLVVYRTDQHIRLVSNGIPATGADPSADYDDEFQGDQTLLVRLGDTVSGAALDAQGNVLTTTETLSVGCEASLPDSHPQAIRTADVYFRDHVGVSSAPAASLERASEDWAQAAVRFRLAGQGTDFTPVRNVLQVDGEAAVAGTVTVRATDGCCFAPITVNVSFPILAGATAEAVAQAIADSIDAHPQFTARHVEHEPGFSDPVWWVAANPGAEIVFDNISTPDGLMIVEPQLRFPPSVSSLLIGTNEQHSIALNFQDSDSLTVNAYAIPNGSLGTDGLGRQVAAQAFAHSYWVNRMRAVANGIFITKAAIDGTDASRPLTFGHELGHILGLPHDSQHGNLMRDSTSPRETYEATKRLRQAQISTARQTSGPGSANPILRQN